MSETFTSCCFTGHRASKLPWGFDESAPGCKELKEKIYEKVLELYSCGCLYYICGMANGCDLYFGEAVLKLKAQHPEIELESAVPCLTQAKSWPAALKQRYNNILSASVKVTVISEAYTRSCMMQRNRYMLDNSDILLACYDGESTGGTLNTILLAHRAGKKVILIEI